MVHVHDGTGGSAVVRMRLVGPPGVCEAVIEVLREALPVVRVTGTADDRTDPDEIQVFAVAQVDRPDPAGTVVMRLECGCSLDVPGRYANEVGPIVACDLHGQTSILDRPDPIGGTA